MKTQKQMGLNGRLPQKGLFRKVNYHLMSRLVAIISWEIVSSGQLTTYKHGGVGSYALLAANKTKLFTSSSFYRDIVNITA